MPYGAIIGAALVAGSTAYAASQAPGAPAPSYAGSTSEGIFAQARWLPLLRQIEAAARTGGKVTVPKLAGGSETYDFKGISDSDVQAKQADAMAQTMLDVQQKYGKGFVDARLAELQASDPEGFQARKTLYDQINQEIGNQPDTSISTKLRDEIMGQLDRGGELDPEVAKEVEQSTLRNQSAIGNTLGNAPAFERAMSIGTAAETRRRQRQDQALGFLSSGATPDDISFRRFQQNVGNLGSFVQGTTPQAQFGQLSGAQNGAAPFQGGGPLHNGYVDAQAAANGAAQFNSGVYSTSVNQAIHAPNPWTTGLSTGINAYNTQAAQSGGRMI